MRRNGILKKIWPLLIAPLLLGWHHILSPEAYFSANHGVNKARVLANPEAWQGTTLILGGEIVEARKQNGDTALEIYCYNLDENGRPVDPDTSCGRFTVKTERSLDSQRFEEGRLVTLTGTVAAEARTARPVFEIGEIRLWPEKKEYDRSFYPRPYYYPYYYDPFCDPFRHPFHWRSRWCW